MKKPPRKRRTREHVIADLAVHHVEGHALRCGFVLERVVHDYGLDVELYTFNHRGEVEEGPIFLQMKASTRLKIRANQGTFPFQIERRDLVHWLAQPLPVILIVYDALRDVAYWLYVQSHFRQRKDFNLFTAGQTVTVQVPLTNVVRTSALRQFRRFRNRVLAQMRKVIHEEQADSVYRVPLPFAGPRIYG
jgi:hypothetical protein